MILSPGASGAPPASRARHDSPCTRTHASPPSTTSTVPEASTSSSRPLTIFLRRAFKANVPTPMMNAALVSAIATSVTGASPKPGTSVSISIRPPNTNATMPPTPSTPKLGRSTSATISAVPSSSRPTPTQLTGSSCSA